VVADCRGRTAGRAEHCLDGNGRAAARAPEFSVSQASAGQVTGLIVVVTSDPTAPVSASRQIAGVAAADTSVQRNPSIPITITGRPDPGAVPADCAEDADCA
jgi:hypothetical protein